MTFFHLKKAASLRLLFIAAALISSTHGTLTDTRQKHPSSSGHDVVRQCPHIPVSTCAELASFENEHGKCTCTYLDYDDHDRGGSRGTHPDSVSTYSRGSFVCKKLDTLEIWCQGHLNKEAARDGYLMEHDLRNQQTQGHHHSTTPHTVGANGSIHHEANHDPESDLPYVKGNAIVGSKDVQKTPARVAFLFVCFGAITVAIAISLLVFRSGGIVVNNRTRREFRGASGTGSSVTNNSRGELQYDERLDMPRYTDEFTEEMELEKGQEELSSSSSDEEEGEVDETTPRVELASFA